MLDPERIPTPLLEREARPPVRLVPSRKPSRFRTLQVVLFLVRLIGRWILWAVRARLGGRTDLDHHAAQIRHSIERLGGLWIKAGQLVALRRDIFADELCEELSKLQDRATGFPLAEARAAIERDLGAPIDEVFAALDPAPLAAASVGQTHVGVLRGNGVKVAVKVQRPLIGLVFAHDFKNLRRLVWCLERLGVIPHARWRDMLYELRRVMTGELDYRLEASSIRRMKKTLKPHGVYVPKVFEQYSGQRLITMEFIDGVLMSDYIRAHHNHPARLRQWLGENDVDPARVGRLLYETHTRQVFEDNLFHADLHPGNLILLRDSRLALVDFGSVGSIEATKMRKYYMIFRAIATRDYSKAADLFFLIAPELPDIDTEETKQDVIRVFRDWEDVTAIRSLPYHQRSLTFAMQRIATVFRKRRIPIAWELLQVNRAEITLDSSLAYLLPEIDYHQMIRRFERRALRRQLEQATSSGALAQRVVSLLALADLPVSLWENVQLQGEWLRQRARRFERTVTMGELLGRHVAMMLTWAAFTSFVVVGAAFLHRSWPTGVSTAALDVVTRILPGLPDYTTPVWIALIVACAYTWRVSWNVVVRLRERPPPGPLL